MTALNRREWIAGAAALFGSFQLPEAFARPLAASDGTALTPPKPRDLLATSFPLERLRRNLTPAREWHPFPSCEDRADWNALPADATRELLAQAQKLLGTPWPTLPASVFLDFARNGNRSRYESLYFARRGRLAAFALAECIEDKGRFLDEVLNGLWLICEETFWGLPAHLSLQKAGNGLPDASEPVVDLFAAQTASTLAWTRYLLAPRLARLSPLLDGRLQDEIERRILTPAFTHDDFWWMWKGNSGSGARLNNWNPWINSNLLTANLLAEPDAERRARAIHKLCRSTDAFLADYSEDGACEEGPGYWGESAAAYFDLCAQLVSAVRGAPALLADPFLRRMTHYPVDIHIAGRYSVNYGDATALAGAPGLLAYTIGRATGDNELAAFGASSLPADAALAGLSGAQAGFRYRHLSGLFALGEACRAPKADALGRDSWYPALRLATARQRAGSTDGFYFALQAAPNFRSHGHNDSGSFIVFHDGAPVFVDAGTQAYTAQTFSKDRYKIWIMQSAYHNLPTIGGQQQATGKPQFRAADPHFATSDTAASIAVDLAPAYPAEAGIRHWRRSLTLDRANGRIRLVEDFALGMAQPVVLNFLTPRTPSTGGPGQIVLTALKEGQHPVSLRTNSLRLEPHFEKIEIDDPGLRATWGQLYRIQLASPPVVAGNWSFEIS